MDTKKLRQKILDLAIHGKLVPQDPNDEPASVLLERIRTEKERLIKEGKIKRSKKSASSDTPHYENVPFEVPDSWKWCKLDDFSVKVTDFVASGSFASLRENVKYYKDKNYAIIVRTTDFSTDFQKDLVYTDKHGYEFLQNSNLVGGELILPNIGASIGKVFIVPKLDHLMTLGPNSILIRTIDEITTKYLFSYFSSAWGWNLLQEISSSTAQGKFNKTELKEVLIPIPPYDEQYRIIEKLNYWFTLIDVLEENTYSLEESIRTIKSRILDLAIRGKLVSQDPNDEPAIDILKRINPKFVPCDNAHYENVPSNWALARVEDIGKLLSGRDLTNDECNSENIGLPYLIGASNIEGNTFSFIRWTEKPQVISQIGDILISCKGTIGAIAKNDIGDIHIARQFMAIRPNTDGITSDYLHICMIAVVEEIKKDARGVIPGIARDDILNKVFAIPPINEQRRIIAAINQYHSILDNISANL